MVGGKRHQLTHRYDLTHSEGVVASPSYRTRRGIRVLKQPVSVLVVLLLCATSPALGQMAYDEPLAHTEAFRKALQAQDYEGAFRVLKPSEGSTTAHPLDLFFLAAIYDDEAIPGLGTQRERALKFWELCVRAALTGYEPAVIELINAFLRDDETLGFDSDEEVAECLEEIIGSRAYVSSDRDWLDPKLVNDCLLLASSLPIDIHGESDSSR